MRISRNGKDYWYHQEKRGQPDAGPRTRLPEYGTPEFWAAVAKITNEPAPASVVTVKSLIEEYKLTPEWGHHRDGTRRTYLSAFKHIEKAWGHLHPAQVSIAGIDKLRDAHANTPSMWNVMLPLIRNILKLAVRREYRADNPAREIDTIEVEPDEAKPLTEAAWLAAISDAAPLPIRRYAVLARATGQRISDVLPFRPSDRDQDGIVLQITKARDKEHWCPLRPDEIAIIDGWKVFRGAYYIEDQGQGLTDAQFRRLWREFAATENGAALRGFTPHDLRASKVCDERIRGKTHQQISAMVGMSIGMVIKYSRHIDQRAAARGTSGEQSNAKF